MLDDDISTSQQATTIYKQDGTSTVSTWYEALLAPGKLRIGYMPLEKHDGVLFADHKIYTYRDRKLADTRNLVHPLLLLGFDVYKQPIEKTTSQLTEMGIKLPIVHEELWHGKTAIVVGANRPI